MPMTASAADFDPAESAQVRAMVDRVASEGVSREWLNDAISHAQFKSSVLDAMSGAAEYNMTWERYRRIFLDEERIDQGAAFIQTHLETFERAEREFGVAPEIIAAILGVETRYGRITGDHRVLDSLSTLAFHHPRRGDFFLGELEAFLQIAYEQEVDPTELKGSYAGAMGYPQFIPTSYQAYAVDFDGDGHRDLWTNPDDVIGSVANYFAEHRWQRDGRIYWDAEGPGSPPSSIAFNRADRPDVSVGELAAVGIVPEESLPADQQVVPLALDMGDGVTQYRMGGENFYVITRYNHSYLYAMAVTELAEAIAEVRELAEGSWLQATETEPQT
nr:lytic murein transglycosylase B [Halomonas huangheensis]